MLLKDMFVKPNFIAFYKTDEKYLLLNEKYKKNTLIDSETKEFENKKDLDKYIKLTAEDNPQTYVSTVILSPNQGCVPSCNRQKYKSLGIEIDNIKILCVKNRYSFYTTLYELMEMKKKYSPDFLYSILALIDKKATIKHNTLYVLTIKEYYYFCVYRENIPVFSDIFEIEEESVEEGEDIEDISDIDIVEDFDETLDDDIENIEDEEIENDESISTLNVEVKVLEYIKTALKEYYESGGDFVEKIIILDTLGMDKNALKTIQEELFIEAEKRDFDILKTINEISRENV